MRDFSRFTYIKGSCRTAIVLCSKYVKLYGYSNIIFLHIETGDFLSAVNKVEKVNNETSIPSLLNP